MYAASTSVPVDRSKAEIERTLERYGATAFGYGWDAKGATIVFKARERTIRFKLPLPVREEFSDNSSGEVKFQQALRSRWRALCLAVKAKLECVESGIATFEDEFLAYIVLPNQSTVSEWLEPQIGAIYGSGKMPMLLEWNTGDQG